MAGGGNEAACAHGSVVLLAVPYAAHASTLEALRPALAGKILIDITVPLRPPKVRTVHLPRGGSAALEAQAILGAETPVVATLHHVSSAHLGDPDRELAGDVLLCGPKPAREAVVPLLSDLGVRALEAGPLQNAVALESLTPVLLWLNKRYGGPGTGIQITGIPEAQGRP